MKSFKTHIFAATLIVILAIILANIKSLFPIAILFAGSTLCLLIWSLAIMVGQIRQERRLSLRRSIPFLVALIILELLYGLFLHLIAALSHGGDMSEVWLKCFLSFLVIVAGPATALVIYHRFPSRGLFLVLFIGCAGLIIYSTTSSVPGISATIIDNKGRPVKGAYVIYMQTPAQEGPSARHGIRRTDSSGRFRISRKIILQFPFQWYLPFSKPNFPPTLELTIYSPTLHDYLKIKNSYNRPLQEQIDLTRSAESTAGTMIQLYDATNDSEKWFASLQDLRYAASSMNVSGTIEEKSEFLAQMKEDHNLFISKYGRDIRKGMLVGGEEKPWDFFLREKDEYGKAIEDWLTFYEGLLAKNRH